MAASHTGVEDERRLMPKEERLCGAALVKCDGRYCDGSVLSNNGSDRERRGGGRNAKKQSVDVDG